MKIKISQLIGLYQSLPIIIPQSPSNPFRIFTAIV
jgi:hypothetical protein